MIVYVESNFVLELALEQEQASSCEAIVGICELGKAHLVIPGFCLGEPYETLGRRAYERTQLRTTLTNQVKLLLRSQFSQQTIDIHAINEVMNLLTDSGKREHRRLHQVLDRLLKVAELIPWTREILAQATDYQSRFNLKAPDAIVYASVLEHLTSIGPAEKCFLNRNSKDFDDVAIQTPLASYGCKMLFRFDSGLSYLQSHLSS